MPGSGDRQVLVVGDFVAGWSIGRTPRTSARPRAIEVAHGDRIAPSARVRTGRSGRRVLAATCAAAAVAGAVLLFSPSAALAPLVSPAVAAREQALAAKRADVARLHRIHHQETARLHLLRDLELAGIAARGGGGADLETPPAPAIVPMPPVVQPSQRAVALANYVQALGTQTILTGLEASRDQLQQQVLHDLRVHIYPGGAGDVTSGRVDVRVLAMIEYLAQADGEVTVSCLISGHSLYVHGRPGVVSAHIYGRAVDISAVGNVPILGHQGAGTITEQAIEQILALPSTVEPVQVISLMTLGGPSFALADHYNHIHIGY
jgi:hypothetical protein